MLTFRFTGASGEMVTKETLTSGTVGKKVKLEFSTDWAGMTKTAVFVAGDVTRDVVGVSEVVTIPAEVLAVPLETLYVGVYGTAADGRVIPTIRAEGPRIEPGVDPSGDRGTDPGLPVWAQLQQKIEEVKRENQENSGQKVWKELGANLKTVGFVRANGTISTAASGLRTAYISTEDVRKISGNAGFFASGCVIAFYDAQKTFLADISVVGSSLTAEGSGYGEGSFELDITGEAYADAAYFIVSTYRGTDYTGNIQTFEDDFCRYEKLVEAEDAPIYRIADNTIVFFGDSITAGAGDGGYPALIEEITGAAVANNAASGSTLASGTAASNHICEAVAGYTGTADIICVSGGINDYNQNVPLGALTEGYTAELDTATVTGALESIFRSLMTNHTASRICYVITHKAASAEVNGNALGLTFEDYHDAIVSVLKKYSVPFYDAFAESGFVTSEYGAWGEAIRSMYTVNADGVHPNREGYLKYYVYQIISMMESGIGSGADGGGEGDSPVRGTDYWTDADKAEIKSYVDEAILGGAW